MSDLVGTTRAAQILGVSTSTLYNWEKQGLIRAGTSLTGYRKWSRSELEALASRQRDAWQEAACRKWDEKNIWNDHKVVVQRNDNRLEKLAQELRDKEAGE